MDGHAFLFHPFVFDGAFWLQTNGTPLLAVNRYSLACVGMAAEDGRSAGRLLYSDAV